MGSRVKRVPDFDWFNTGPMPGYLWVCLNEKGFKSLWQQEFSDAPCEDHWLPHKRGGCVWRIRHTSGVMHQVMCLDGEWLLESYNKKQHIQIAGLIAHEAVHVWQNMEKEMSAEGDTGMEPFAWAVQYYVININLYTDEWCKQQRRR